jgi:hypothetical protein
LEATSASRTALTFLVGWPEYGHDFTREEWHIAIQSYMGLPLSILSSFAGSKVVGKGVGGGVDCDKYGRVLATAQLPGADWWKAHNFVMREVAEQAGVAGVDLTLEPANVFHPELPSAVDVSDDRFKAVEGIRPDGLLRGSTTSIVELKVIRHTEAWYGGSENMRAHKGNNRRAMDRRATRTEWEYKKKAKDLDDLFNDGEPKVQNKLGRLGLQCLVVGWFGEISRDFEDLLDWFADEGSKELHRDMLCLTEEQAKAIMLFKMRSRVNSAVMKAQARIILSRLRHLRGRPAAILSYAEKARTRFFPRGDPSAALARHGAMGRVHALRA